MRLKKKNKCNNLLKLVKTWNIIYRNNNVNSIIIIYYKCFYIYYRGFSKKLSGNEKQPNREL